MTETGDDRDRGILSTVDREYLRDPDAFSRQGGYQRRAAIRNRVENAFVDLRVLFDELDDETITDVFGVEKYGPQRMQRIEIPQAKRALPLAVALMARISVLTDANVSPEHDVETALQPLAETVDRGIEEFLGEKYGLTGDIEVTLSAENVRPTEELAAELRQSDDLSDRERLEKAAELARIGFTDEEIADILGEI